jgi:hypothetical protein
MSSYGSICLMSIVRVSGLSWLSASHKPQLAAHSLSIQIGLRAHSPLVA